MTEAPSVRRIRFWYRKAGPSRFISHRNFCSLVERGLRRAEFPLVFSMGFTPRPKISFGPPLPVGIAGNREPFDVWTYADLDPDPLLGKEFLFPEGTRLLSAAEVRTSAPPLSATPLIARYRIERQGIVDHTALMRTGTPAGEDERYLFLDIAITGFNHTMLLAAAGSAAIERTILCGDNNRL